jgi:hypothetical protein
MYISEMRRTGRIGAKFRACVAYGTHRSTPVYAVVALGDGDPPSVVADRWRAASVEIADGTFRVDDVLEYPSSRVQTNRWAAVADDLLHRETGPRKDAGLTLDQELTLLNAIRETARSRMSRTELLAAAMHKPTHYFYDEDGPWSTVVEALGLEPGVTRSATIIESREGPYGFLRLGEAIGLPRGASISHLTSGNRIDRSHPLRKFGSDVANLLKEFNSEQPRIEVDLEPGKLEDWLQPLLEQRCSDVASMVRAVGFDEPREPGLEVFLVTSAVPDGAFGSVPPAALVMRRAPETKVHYAIVEPAIRNWGYDELVKAFPEAESPHRRGFAYVDDAIAAITGYADEDLSVFGSLKALGLLKER